MTLQEEGFAGPLADDAGGPDRRVVRGGEDALKGKDEACSSRGTLPLPGLQPEGE